MLDPVPVIAQPDQLTSMYRQIVECGNEGIWVFDLDGRTAYVNLRMAQMLDYSVAEMTALSLLDVLDDQGRDQGAAFLARQRATGGTTESAECLLLRRDGEPVWSVVSHSPWLDSDGSLRGLVAFVNDITERRRLSEALARREEQLAEAQRVARLGSWEWDVDTDVLTWSDELYRVFGLEPGDFAGTLQAYLELVHPDDRQLTAQVIQSSLAGRHAFEFEQRIRIPGRDDVVWIRTAGEVLPDESGSPVRLRGTALDITAYKETEDRLRRARSRSRLLQTMAAAANEAQTLAEVAQTSVRELCSHLRWPAGRVYLVPDPDGPPVPAGGWYRSKKGPDSGSAGRGDLLGTTMAAGEVSQLALDVVTTAATRWSPDPDEDHSCIPLITCAIPVRSRNEVVAVLEFVVPADARHSEALAICDEVAVQLAVVAERERTNTELHAARDAALTALRAKSAFLATMSHEIRTPMNGVIGLAELLLASDLDDRQRQYVVGVQTAGDALLTIINDILDFSKIEAGRLELEPTDIDVTQLVEEVAALLARQAQAKGLELITRMSRGTDTPLRGDPARLRQVLINLAGNAIKFTEHGEVLLSAQLVAVTSEVAETGGADQDTVGIRFEVADTGIGIDTSDQRLIFEPFTQADASTTRRFGGTGLGLAISRDLVESMGGRLEVHSRPGEGSRFGFTVRLPRSGVAVTRPEPGPPAPRWAGTPVLVVDDNATNRLILTEQLSGWGLAPQLADDGATALDLLQGAAVRKEPFPLALLDMTMPEMDGLELARRIGDEPALAGTQLVLLTSTDVTPHQLEGVALAAHLNKPVRSAQLHDCLAEVLRPVLESTSADSAAAPAVE